MMRIPGVPFTQGRNDYSDSDGRKYGVAIHNTSNDASAEAEASYATRRTDGISAHLYVDRDSVVQSLDTDDRAGHAGSTEGNQHAVAVEITGVNGWTRQQWLDRVAWSKLGAALAHVVRKYGIEVRRASVTEMRSNPKVRAFYGHDDMRRAWGGTTHTDPGPNFPWDKLFSSVNAALAGEDDDMPTVSEIWGAQFGPRDARITAGQMLAEARTSAATAVAQVTALRSVVETLAETIRAGGGSVDTAAILRGVDERVAKAESEIRDAVADLGEGGAEQVRADAAAEPS